MAVPGRAAASADFTGGAYQRAWTTSVVDATSAVQAQVAIAVDELDGARHWPRWLLHQRGVRAAGRIDVGDRCIRAQPFFILSCCPDAGDEFQFLARVLAGLRCRWMCRCCPIGTSLVIHQALLHFQLLSLGLCSLLMVFAFIGLRSLHALLMDFGVGLASFDHSAVLGR